MGVQLSKHDMERIGEERDREAVVSVSMDHFTKLTRKDVCEFFETSGTGSVFYSKHTHDIRLANHACELSAFFEVGRDNAVRVRRSDCIHGAFAVACDASPTAMCCYEQRGGAIASIRVMCWCDETAEFVSRALANGCMLGGGRVCILAPKTNVKVSRISGMEHMRFTIHAVAGWYLYNRAVSNISDADLCTLLDAAHTCRSHMGEEKHIVEFVSKVRAS